MITKIRLVENTYLSPAAMAAAKQESYLLLHTPTPWLRIGLKIFAAIIVVAMCIKWIVRT